MSHDRAMRLNVDGIQVVVLDRLLPPGAPLRRVFRSSDLLNGSAARLNHPYVAATNEPERSVIEMIAVEVVDHLAARAGADEGVHRLVLAEEDLDAAGHLIGIVAPHDPLAGRRVVRLADSRQEQKLRVIELEGGQDNEIGRLEDLAALSVDVGDAGGALARGVQIDAQDVRPGT